MYCTNMGLVESSFCNDLLSHCGQIWLLFYLRDNLLKNCLKFPKEGTNELSKDGFD